MKFRNRNSRSNAVTSVIVVGFVSIGFLVQFAPNVLTQLNVSTSLQKFGFAVLGGAGSLMIPPLNYNPTNFYQGMFMTPPYPSVVNFQLGTSGGWEQASQRAWTDQLISMLTSNQYLMIQLGINDATTGSTDVTAFFSYVGHLGTLPNKGQITLGVDMEHTNVCSACSGTRTVTQAQLDQWTRAIANAGIRVVNRYPSGVGSGVDSSRYVWEQNTGWPFGGDISYAVSPNQPNFVGIRVGLGPENSPFPFQECIGPNVPGYVAGYPGWTTVSVPAGANPSPSFGGGGPCLSTTYFPATLTASLSVNAGAPHGEFIVINGGLDASCWGPSFSCPVYFAGVSGVNTDHLWDNPEFRQTIWSWIQANPGFYLLGNSGGPPLNSTTIPTSTSQHSTFHTTSLTWINKTSSLMSSSSSFTPSLTTKATSTGTMTSFTSMAPPSTTSQTPTGTLPNSHFLIYAGLVVALVLAMVVMLLGLPMTRKKIGKLWNGSMSRPPSRLISRGQRIIEGRARS